MGASRGTSGTSHSTTRWRRTAETGSSTPAGRVSSSDNGPAATTAAPAATVPWSVTTAVGRRALQQAHRYPLRLDQAIALAEARLHHVVRHPGETAAGLVAGQELDAVHAPPALALPQLALAGDRGLAAGQPQVALGAEPR